MNKEQIEKLIDYVHMSHIQANRTREWIEQNPQEPVVVGLTELQLRDIFDRTPHKPTFEEFVEAYQEWSKTQTFAQPLEVPADTYNKLVSEMEELQDKYDSLYEEYQSLIVDKTQLELKCGSLSDALLELEMGERHMITNAQIDSLIESNRKAGEEIGQLKAQLQFTPSWENAPKWANWVAKNATGEWVWYEQKPGMQYGDISTRWAVESGNSVAAIDNTDWKETLQQRPTPPAPKVEVGKYVRKYDEYSQEVDVLHIGDMIVNGDYLSSVVFNVNGKIRAMATDDFLAKFERVQS
jgi:hypothetical protein